MPWIADVNQKGRIIYWGGNYAFSVHVKLLHHNDLFEFIHHKPFWGLVNLGQALLCIGQMMCLPLRKCTEFSLGIFFAINKNISRTHDYTHIGLYRL